MSDTATLPNPYLDNVDDTLGAQCTAFGAVGTFAYTIASNERSTADYVLLFVHNLLGRSTARKDDESIDDWQTRSVRAALWSLSLAVRVYADQGVKFRKCGIQAPEVDECTCGTDHGAEAEIMLRFLDASVDGTPDNALAVMMEASREPEKYGPPHLIDALGPMSGADVERYLYSHLVHAAARAVALATTEDE